MAFPLAPFIIGTTAVSGGISAFGSYKAGSEAKENAARQDALLQEEADKKLELAKKMRGQIRYRTAMETIRLKREADLVEGAQRVAIGASGVDVSAGGSVVDVVADTASQFALDAFLIKKAGAMQEEAVIESAKAEGDSLIAQGHESLLMGASRFRAGQTGAGAGLLRSAVNIGSIFAGSRGNRTPGLSDKITQSPVSLAG